MDIALILLIIQWVCVGIYVYLIVRQWRDYRRFDALVRDLERQRDAGTAQSQAPQPLPSNAEARAAALARRLLGEEGMQQIERGHYIVQSGLCPQVQYRLSGGGISLWKDGLLTGNFCLQSRGPYPAWDDVLSRIYLLRGAEVEFLRTANFAEPYEQMSAARPMRREQAERIYGQEGVQQWANSSSSSHAPATAR
jgi:hypothetical protein